MSRLWSVFVLVLVLVPALASAKTVELDDRAFARHINAALDEVDEMERIIDRSELRGRQKESLLDEVDELRSELKRVRKTLDRGESVKHGVLLDDRDLFADIDDVSEAVRAFEKELDDSDLEREERKLVRESLDAVSDAMKDADKLVAAAPEVDTVVDSVVEVKEPKLVEMDAASFAALNSSIQNSSFDSDKVKAIGTAARSGNYFTCAQVVSLLGHLSFDSDKVEAAATLYPNVVDPKNWFMVFDTFTFDSSRDDLRSRLGL
ncbi:MAG: DUF4476 domain-containing protein [Myxococcota bacterium]|nr:DUF4476 domain-containing protein [Myxococcota bacterium]